MLGKLLGHDKRQIEYVFGDGSVTTFARTTAVEEVRNWKDRALFRKVHATEPAWSAAAEGFTFAAGGGARGDGALWTRPVRLEPDVDLEGAFVQLFERRGVEDGAGSVTLVAHVRAKPAVGAGEDVESRAFPVHADGDGGDETWHGTVHDLAPLLRRHQNGERYLTLEIQVTAARTGRSARSLTFGLRPVVLTLTAAPRGPVSAWPEP